MFRVREECGFVEVGMEASLSKQDKALSLEGM